MAGTLPRQRRRESRPVLQTDTTRRPDDHLRLSALVLQRTAPRPLRCRRQSPQPSDSPLSRPRHQQPLPHQQRQAQKLPAFLNNRYAETKPRETGNSRYGIPPRRAKGRLLAGSRAECASSLSSGAALRAPLHAAPGCRAICHSANYEEGTQKWPTPNTLLVPALPISPAITIKRLPIASSRPSRPARARGKNHGTRTKQVGHPCPSTAQRADATEASIPLSSACPPLPSPAMIRAGVPTGKQPREAGRFAAAKKAPPSSSSNNCR